MNEAPIGRAADLARYYDLDLLDDPRDLPMYLALAASTGGPILELAAGSGRLAVPLAAAGYDVTAVDNDRAMIDRARRAWANRADAGRGGTLTLIEHDLTTLHLKERFGLVILALNSLLLLPRGEPQARALQVMRGQLAPEGRAIIDVWLPSPDDLTLYDGRQRLEWIRTDPETGERIAKATSARYERASRTATLTTTFDASPLQASGPDAIGDEPARHVKREDTIYFVGPDELLSMAADAGLAPVNTVGDYDMSPLSDESERIVLIARAASA